MNQSNTVLTVAKVTFYALENQIPESTFTWEKNVLLPTINGKIYEEVQTRSFRKKDIFKNESSAAVFKATWTVCNTSTPLHC